MEIIKVEPSGVTNKKIVTYQGLSTEPLPALPPDLTGSRVYLVDTGVWKVFHENQWYDK